MKKKLPTRTEVLDLVGSDDRAWHVHEIASKLAVPEVSVDGLHRLLDDMTFDGVLVVRGGQRFKLGKTQSARGARDRREGTLSVNARGFGFVAAPNAIGDDVFVPGEALGGAMHGDTVVVEIVARSNRGAEGQIVEIKERKAQRVSGILRRRGKSAWVEPDDPRVRGPITLASELDATGPEGNSGNEGDVVVVRITRFPESPNENPEGKLDAVLGRPGEISVEVKKVLFLGNIEELHSDDAVAEAEAYGTEVPTEMLEGREDLTHIPLPTIDPDDARDHDDAVWVERTDKGGYKLWVAIADVSTYVRPGTHIDEEAKKRGTSVYLPDRAIPMLPRALSSNLCSLLPGVTRLCLCVEAELDANATVRKVRLIRGVMKSAAKLTYGGVARALGYTELPARQPDAEKMIDGLKVAQELSAILRGKRLKRGALDFNLPEAVIVLDDDGKPTDIKKRTQDPGIKKAYQLIEELMIFANEAVAEHLLERDLGAVFRIHQAPDEEKLAKLSAMCEVLGVHFDMERTQNPRELSLLLKSFEDHPRANVLNMLLLRSMKQAVYDPTNLGHFGLASKAYLHFTSPIRRYPDLVVHRIVHAAALSKGGREGKKALAALTDPEILSEAAISSSQAERRVMEVERQVADVYRTFFMMDKIGERYEATITAFVGSGAFASIDDPFVDVMIRLEDMGGDFEIADDGLEAISSRSGDAIRLGDSMMVEIVDCAILRRTVYARRIAGEAEIARTGGAPLKRRGKNGRPSFGKAGRDDAPGHRGKPGRDGGRGSRSGRDDAPARDGRSTPGDDARPSSGAARGRPATGRPGGGKPSGGRPGGGRPGGGRPGGGKPGGGKPGGGKPGGGKPGGGKPGGGKPGGAGPFKGKKNKSSKKGTVRGKRR